MVERLSGRAQFAHLRAQATTVREGRLRISCAEPDETIGPAGPAVAFSVPRRYGSAVRRNLLRRRLRAIIRDAAARGDLPARWFLVTVNPSDREPRYSELRRWFHDAVETLGGGTRSASGSAPGGGVR